MTNVEISSGGTTDTSNKNTDFFAALASTSEQVEKMENIFNNPTNAMSVADYKKEKQISNSEIFKYDDEGLEPETDFMEAITPLLKYLERQGKIQILDNTIEIESEVPEFESITEEPIQGEELYRNIIREVDIVSDELDTDTFLDTYYEAIMNYLDTLGYSEEDGDSIVEGLLEYLGL